MIQARDEATITDATGSVVPYIPIPPIVTPAAEALDQQLRAFRAAARHT